MRADGPIGAGDVDADLLAAAVSDAEAFGEFYDRNVESVVGFFMRRTACPQTAADLSAETFAEALRRLEAMRAAASTSRSVPSAVGSRWANIPVVSVAMVSTATGRNTRAVSAAPSSETMTDTSAERATWPSSRACLRRRAVGVGMSPVSLRRA